MSPAADALSGMQAMQAALQMVQTMALTAWRFPPTCIPSNCSYYDFIVVGGGTAGSILANRLSANPDYSVLLVEAGGPPPEEADKAGLFGFLVDSACDFNFTTVPDNYNGQNLQGGCFGLTQGMMLGGSSALNHLIHVHGHPLDYDAWADELNDPSWNYDNILPYLKKLETLMDPGLLMSPFANKYGTKGPIKITRELNLRDKLILEAFGELGHVIGDDVTLGYTVPLLANFNNIRQCSSLYLTEAKSRPNLCVSTYTKATKILIKDGVAIGVQVTDSNGDTQVYYANKEVIVSAGAFNSPKLLMLSGIGPKDHLQSHCIDVVADLPVGRNLQDHVTGVLVYPLEESITPSPATNPGKFPTGLTTGYVALDPEQTYPDYQAFNLVAYDSPAFFQLCSKVFKFTDSFCDRLYNATIGRNTLFACIGLLRPKSEGKVLLASADPDDKPLIYLNAYSDRSDLELMAASLKDYNRVLETAYFKRVNASLVDAGLCKDARTEDEYWECYALGATSTLFHYVGTNAMGSVLDSSLRVKEVDRLRVIDSSSMPKITRGNNNAPVQMIAERGADLILQRWGMSC